MGGKSLRTIGAHLIIDRHRVQIEPLIYRTMHHSIWTRQLALFLGPGQSELCSCEAPSRALPHHAAVPLDTAKVLKRSHRAGYLLESGLPIAASNSRICLKDATRFRGSRHQRRYVLPETKLNASSITCCLSASHAIGATFRDSWPGLVDQQLSPQHARIHPPSADRYLRGSSSSAEDKAPPASASPPVKISSSVRLQASA
jgi:hypothetical protein